MQTSGKPKPGLDDIGGQIQATRDQMRDFIWKATDSIVQAVEDMPDIGVCRCGRRFLFGSGVGGPLSFSLLSLLFCFRGTSSSNAVPAAARETSQK